ncbi:hypothetical protein B0I37DRAFT_376892 [Chaetomium sp. MPI-CAGE-AT-0009]|nr:hypothetical protein B0I37DRAFT_376892 [Chaetomium sp. MPI-CAGE-AT-0009]
MDWWSCCALFSFILALLGATAWISDGLSDGPTARTWLWLLGCVPGAIMLVVWLLRPAIRKWRSRGESSPKSRRRADDLESGKTSVGGHETGYVTEEAC